MARPFKAGDFERLVKHSTVHEEAKQQAHEAENASESHSTTIEFVDRWPNKMSLEWWEHVEAQQKKTCAMKADFVTKLHESKLKAIKDALLKEACVTGANEVRFREYEISAETVKWLKIQAPLLDIMMEGSGPQEHASGDARMWRITMMPSKKGS